MLSESDGHTCLKQRLSKDRLRFHSLPVKIILEDLSQTIPSFLLHPQVFWGIFLICLKIRVPGHSVTVRMPVSLFGYVVGLKNFT
jgi:hypothetical protein